MTTCGMFGARLRAVRHARKLTLVQLAQQVSTLLRKERSSGCDFTYLSKIEKGRLPPPSVRAIVALATVLGVPSDEMLAWAGKAPHDLGQWLATSAAAREFLRRAQAMQLDNYEWQVLGGCLRVIARDRDSLAPLAKGEECGRPLSRQ